ncbi:unnamed protein product [Lepeophtheirus salmonis]|uniref:(salmon louse) hypothetical protein n=1 Tax=Lepeophtheirus salmonis TaxID=72036 RepID=A0A0K2UDB7_LEPSM|nr:unnamed protein product [Lepeophtheirus salmonis]CAF2838440.1 unnamed protein product [Lepeophtheirus salmonis]
MIDEELDMSHDDYDEQLVKEIKKYRLLWDTNHKDYKDANKKIHTWKIIALKLKKPGGAKELKRRWKNLRDGLVRSIRKNAEASQISKSEMKVSKCKLFDELLFLKDFISYRPTPIEIPFGCGTQRSPEVYKSVDIETHVITEQETFDTTIIRFEKDVDKINHDRFVGGEGSEECESIKRLKMPNNSGSSGLSSVNNSVLKPNEDSLSVTASSSGEIENEITKSSNWHFCQSLVDVLDSLPKKKNRMAKIKIQEILMKLEFDEEDQN